MRTATRKHLYHARGLAKFAKVTVGQATHLTVENDLAEPQIILSGSVEDVSEHQEVIVAARLTLADVAGRSFVIHASQDDNSARLACAPFD